MGCGGLINHINASRSHSLLLSSFHCAGSPPPRVRLPSLPRACDCSYPPSKVVTLSIFLLFSPLLLQPFFSLPPKSVRNSFLCLSAPCCQYATSILAAVNRHGRRTECLTRPERTAPTPPEAVRGGKEGGPCAVLCCAVCGREKEAKRHMARWHNSFFSFYFIVLPGRACARLEMGKGEGGTAACVPLRIEGVKTFARFGFRAPMLFNNLRLRNEARGEKVSFS